MHPIILIVLALVAGMLLHRQLMRGKAVKTAMPAPLSRYESTVTAANFDSVVLKASGETPVLVDFYASWCQPCQYLGPVLAEMAESYAGNFLLAKVDVDAEQTLSQKYGVKSMPTVMLFRDGRHVDQFVGARQPHSVRYFLAQNGVKPPQDVVA